MTLTIITYLFSILINSTLIGVAVTLLLSKFNKKLNWLVSVITLASLCAAFDMYWFPAVAELELVVTSSNSVFVELMGETMSAEELFTVDTFTVSIWLFQGFLAHYIGAKVVASKNT